MMFFKYLENYVFCEDIPVKKADICVVLGGPLMIPYRVDEAVKLYNDKKVKKILLCGGIGYFNTKRNITEAELMRNYLLCHNIKDEDILIEKKSKNTYENFLYSHKILKKKNLLDSSFILITSDFHMRRSVYFFRKVFGNRATLYTRSVCDRKADKNSWYKSLYGIRTIVQEALLLKYK